MEWWQPPLWPPMECTWLHPQFTLHTTKWTRDAVPCVGCKCLVLDAKEEVAIIAQYGRVLAFSHPCLVSVHFKCPSLTWNEVSFRNFSPSFLFFLGGFLNQLSNKTHFIWIACICTLQTNAFITSNKIVLATHLREHNITWQTSLAMR